MAAEQGDAESQFYLGRALYKGEGVTRDPEEAMKWLRRSAGQDYKIAHEFLEDECLD
jgi:TPR repeat protein